MKKVVLFCFSLVFSAALVQPLNAQVVGDGGWNNALNRAMAGPTAELYARRAYAPVDYIVGQSGQYVGGGHTVANIAQGAITGAGIGASIAAARGGNATKGALVGAGIGGGATAVLSLAMSHHGGHPLAGPGYETRKKGQDFFLTNQTRFSVEVWFGKGKGKYLGRLASGETWSVKGPKPGERYSGFALIPSANGGLVSDEVPIQPTQNGWVFVEPSFKGRR